MSGNLCSVNQVGYGMADSFGEELRQRRALAGLSQAKLAKAAFVSQSLISKLENGVETPSRQVAEACDRALNADGALLTFLGPPRPVAGEAELEPWELTDTLTRSSLNIRTLDQMRRAVLGYASRYPEASPNQLLPLVNAQLRRLRQALGHPQNISTRRETVGLLGVLGGIAGNLALDGGDRDRAQGYFDVGRMAGAEAEDNDLTAWILATNSIERFYNGEHSESLTLLHEAAGLAKNSSSARRQAWISALMARSQAAMKEDTAALRALDRAYQTMAAVDKASGTDFFDPARLDGFAGATLVLLHRTEEGTRLLAEAIERRADTDKKGKALLTLDLAEGRSMQKEREEASRLVEQAVALAADGYGLVKPIRDRTQAVRAQLGLPPPGV
jgi:transcriptional regulator with XRE-family HTH domain